MMYDVFYAKHPSFNEEDVPKDLADFQARWAFVKCVTANNLEEVFHEMQAEQWSPHGEARAVIWAAGVKHTSMSVGDMVRTADGDYFIVAGVGFKKVELKE